VAAGESPLNQELAAQLLRRLVEDVPKGRRIPEGDPLLESLTPREAEMLRLMTRGYTNQQLARNLHISVSTVKKHVRSVISKLGVSDRTQAAVRAVELGLLAEHQRE